MSKTYPDHHFVGMAFIVNFEGHMVSIAASAFWRNSHIGRTNPQ
jgi:hypothetical protein